MGLRCVELRLHGSIGDEPSAIADMQRSPLDAEQANVQWQQLEQRLREAEAEIETARTDARRYQAVLEAQQASAAADDSNGAVAEAADIEPQLTLLGVQVQGSIP